ncbi:MAG: hypothetical protein LBV42_03215 [Methanobrevibacter sp.]|jgi:hypothetical protein|nr:hypothetical protein [Methanobrevibacter sp.]
MFKKFLSVLLLVVLIIGSLGCNSATSYTYNVSCHLGDKIGVYALCQELEVYDNYHFMLAFYHVGMFKMYWERDDLLIAEAVVPGFKCFTIINNFRPIEDNDYVNFNITEVDPPKPDPVPPHENNSTPVNPDPVAPDVVPSVVPSVSSNNVVGSVNNVVNNPFMNVSNVSNASNIIPIMGSYLLPKTSNDHFIIKFLKDIYKSIYKLLNDFYKSICKLLNDLYKFILNATTYIRHTLISLWEVY